MKFLEGVGARSTQVKRWFFGLLAGAMVAFLVAWLSWGAIPVLPGALCAIGVVAVLWSGVWGFVYSDAVLEDLGG